jgi:excinuclease ABC subunit B
MYADKITNSMQRTIDETNRRRLKQIEYNTEHNIIPKTIIKSLNSALGNRQQKQEMLKNGYVEPEGVDIAADPVIRYMSKQALEETIRATKKNMEKAAAKLDFIEAARLRDEMFALQNLLKSK